MICCNEPMIPSQCGRDFEGRKVETGTPWCSVCGRYGSVVDKTDTDSNVADKGMVKWLSPSTPVWISRLLTDTMLLPKFCDDWSSEPLTETDEQLKTRLKSYQVGTNYRMNVDMNADDWGRGMHIDTLYEDVDRCAVVVEWCVDGECVPAPLTQQNHCADSETLIQERSDGVTFTAVCAYGYDDDDCVIGGGR